MRGLWRGHYGGRYGRGGAEPGRGRGDAWSGRGHKRLLSALTRPERG